MPLKNLKHAFLFAYIATACLLYFLNTANISAVQLPNNQYGLIFNEDYCVGVVGDGISDYEAYNNTEVKITPIKLPSADIGCGYGLRVEFTGEDFTNNANYSTDSEDNVESYYYTIGLRKEDRNPFGDTLSVEPFVVPKEGVAILKCQDPSILNDTSQDNRYYLEIMKYSTTVQEFANTVDGGTTLVETEDKVGHCVQERKDSMRIYDSLAAEANLQGNIIDSPTSVNTSDLYCVDNDNGNISDPDPVENRIGVSWDTQLVNQPYENPQYIVSYQVDLTNAIPNSSKYEHGYILELVDTNGNILNTKDFGSTNRNIETGTFEIETHTPQNPRSYELRIRKITTSIGIGAGDDIITDSCSDLGICEWCVSNTISITEEETEVPLDEVDEDSDESGTSTNPYDPLNPEDATELTRRIVGWFYKFVLPFAFAIAVIKLLVHLLALATSGGDPQKLEEAKENITATIIGIVVIGGAVSLITLLGSALGI